MLGDLGSNILVRFHAVELPAASYTSFRHRFHFLPTDVRVICALRLACATPFLSSCSNKDNPFEPTVVRNVTRNIHVEEKTIAFPEPHCGMNAPT